MSNIFDKELTERHSFAVSMLTSAVSKNRLAHAYLLTGRAVEDKWLFASQLASFLNCSQVTDWAVDAACHLGVAEVSDYCVNCRWISERRHPQAWLTLMAKEGSKSGKIAVDKARQLSEELSKCSTYFRAALVEDASQEIFHRPAANALLKTIENPGDRCIFLLFATREEEVLPTVVSRCQVVPMQNVVAKETSLWQVISGSKSVEANGDVHLEGLRQAFMRIVASRDGGETIRALEFAREIQSVYDESDDSSAVIDFAVDMEMGRLGGKAVQEIWAAGYLSDLLSLAEEAKLQINQYVSARAVIETFVLSWWQLRKSVGC